MAARSDDGFNSVDWRGLYLRLKEEHETILEEVRQLRDRDRLAQHQEDLGIPPVPLTPNEHRMIHYMLARPAGQIISQDRLVHHLMTSPYKRVHDHATPDNQVKVMLTNLRRRLRPIGVEILNHHGIGWQIPADSRARWDQAWSEKNGGAVSDTPVSLTANAPKHS